MSKKIIITSSSYKKELLKEPKLEEKKIYTYEEFKRLFYFDYDEKTILYVMEKYQIKKSIATIYIENLYFIEDKSYKSKKLQFLKKLKEDLLVHNLLVINKLFLSSLKDKEIRFFNLRLTKEMKKVIEKLKEKNQVKIESKKENYEHIIYEFQTLEEEVVFIANDIVKKRKQGIPFNHIFLTNLNKEYQKTIKRIFPMFHIPFTLKEEITLSNTPLGNYFIHNFFKDNLKTLKEIEEKISNKEEESIYNEIIKILNKYAFLKNIEEGKELILYDLKHTKCKKLENENGVKETSIDEVYKEEDYVYLLSFNQKDIPIIYKEEDYLNDKEKEELQLSSTVEKNIEEKKYITECIKRIKNLILTYKTIHNGEDFSISYLNDILNYSIKKEEDLSLCNSNLYNKTLLVELLDEYYKFGSLKKPLEELYVSYPNIPYKSYQHQFTGINKEDLKTFLDNKLTLSYTKLNKYYSCPFSYYINYILRLKKEEDTFAILIGNLFHAVLEHHKEPFDFIWQEEIKKITYPLSEKEKLFLTKLKEELHFVIECIHEQENFTQLDQELYEENVITHFKGDMEITFSGKIDKIKYRKEKDKTIVSIIDYKTGTIEYDLGLNLYGLHLQLPIYIFLAKQLQSLNNVEIAGIYLQKVINNEIHFNPKESYEERKKKNNLLQGYTMKDLSTLSFWDTTYEDSQMIKSLKVTKNKDFSYYSKVLSKQEIEKLESIAVTKIKEAIEEIENANFKINPKKVGTKFDGCTYCTFKDLCFHQKEDYLELEDTTLEDILGGE